ncbi:MAG TPA: hypothetical protein VGQ53_12545 [Chitinophagaceae bacterium]|jgi:hypothetical protein|nr:hypothetical protein [Chitinophagaceae bacterium]
MLPLKDATIPIIVLAILQVLSATYFLEIPNFQALDSFLFLFTGVGISLCLLQVPAIRGRRDSVVNRQLLFKFLVIALLLPISYQLGRHIMDDNPLRYQNADMLPIIKSMNQRFLNGQWKQVYQPIPEIWNGIQPIYLPAMWMPFGLSLIFDFDIRWITVCGIWLSVIICVLPAWRKLTAAIFLIVAFLVLLAWLHTNGDNGVIELTEEGVVYFYYSLLATAIIFNTPWLMGMSVALCLLSRYSFIGWVPFAFLYLVLRKEYKFLLRTSLTALAVACILILPFGMGPLLYHLHLHDDYISHAARVWHDEPETYFETLGMAKFFGASHIKMLHVILVGGSFLIPLSFLLFLRKKIFTQPNILLAGFQLSLTFFYNFLDVTYLYLYYVPVFVSLLIASWSLSEKRRV